MRTTVYRTSVIALLLVLAASFGLQRAARAGDAGAVLGGIIAGAIVYELLDDDDGYYHTHYYYQSPGYYRPPVYGPYGYTYYNYAPPVVVYRYDSCRPRTYHRYDGYYYDGPRTSYQARRAPSHAQRQVGPPPGYNRGGKYTPPRYYK